MTDPLPIIDSIDLHTHTGSEHSTWTVVALTSSTGRVGLGECSDGGTAAFVTAGLATLCHHVIGARVTGDRDPLRTAVDTLRHASDGLTALGWSTLWGGIEAAWDDLAAREQGVPLHEHLGLPPAPPVRLYANINRRWGASGTAAIVAATRSATAAGLSAVKIAPFDPWRGTADVVSAGLAVVDMVRAAVPPDTLLMIDCHRSLPAAALPAAMVELQARSVYWVEDALDVRDTIGLQRLRDTADVPMAGGEHEWDPEVVSAACSSGALDFWLIDPKHAGGPYGTTVLAGCVGNVTLTFHNPSGPIGTLHAVHLAGLSERPIWLEFAWAGSDRADYLTPPEIVDRGLLTVPDGPGIGADLTGLAERAGQRVIAP